METNVVYQERSAANATGDLLRHALRLTGRIYYPATPIIESYPPEESEPIYQSINDWARIIIEYSLKNTGYTNSKGLFRYYMHELGIRVPSEFEDEIKDGDIVEVYGCHGKRLFFHPEVFDFSSYNPEDLFSSRWWDLYQRDPAMTELCMKLFKDVVLGNHLKPFKPGIPNHTVSESISPKRYTIEIEQKLFSPVFMGNVVVGIASLNSFKML